MDIGFHYYMAPGSTIISYLTEFKMKGDTTLLAKYKGHWDPDPTIEFGL